MKKRSPCPYKALMIIIDVAKHVEDKILSVLESYQITRSMISFAQGTAPSTISDFFGFGIVDKMVLSTFVDTKLAETIVMDLQNVLQEDEKNRGIIFTLPITALSSNIIGLWRK